MSVLARLTNPMMRGGGPLLIKGRQSGDADNRWSLHRLWEEEPEVGKLCLLPWIMLNPSTADGSVDDPTLKRIIHFSWMWGFDGLVVFNIYPFRTADPRKLASIVLDWDKRQDWGVRDEIWDNHRDIAGDLAEVDAAMVAWGSPGGRMALETVLWAEQLFDAINDPEGPRDKTLICRCLGHTKAGDPVHPLARGKHRVPNDVRPSAFRNPGTIALGEPA